MKTELSAKVSISDIFFESKELERRGIDVIHFDVGEPDFPPPKEVVEATSDALRSGKSKYTGPGGIPEVREEIAGYTSSKYGIKISPGQVLFTTGGRMALFLAYSSLPRGSKIGVISPDWPAYRDLCEFFSFDLEFFNTSIEGSWTPDLGKIEESKCTALILNYPNNPTGKILDRKIFEEIEGIAERKKMKLISDEVYSDYIFPESKGKFKSILDGGISPEKIFTTSMSKSYAMTGFRAGYMISDEITISKLCAVSSLVLTSAPEFIQYGAIAALRSQDYVKQKVKLIEQRKSIASKALSETGLFDFYSPDGSLYLFPKLKNPAASRDAIDSGQFAVDLLRRAHVSVTPGSVFGPSYSDYLRLTLLESNERIAEGISRISRLLLG